ncbi:hypothetical protein SAMN05444166_5364 [Singulisphaera sp. GP187]|uniref:hypothetical protein n=1 Tax=Singulisphaera sp. GP187 TaxID=1882752 RepID=UPI00092B8434|nr:hypothetical protein [Singulisphaera sp. GP187]SIO57224.1 hypothetical protein SAMN05444166_5364 [Singulisphaera sp. GP187]
MKLVPNFRRVWQTTGLAAGLLLASCLVLTPGCGTEAPKPLEPLAPTTAPEVKAKAKVGKNVEAYDDLKERRAKKRLAAQNPG